MIDQDFKIDFEKKIITYKGDEKKIYTALELYSYIQDLLDDPANMRYTIPMVAKSKTEFQLINGWAIDKVALSHINEGVIS